MSHTNKYPGCSAPAECSLCCKGSAMTITGKESCYCVFPVCHLHKLCAIECRKQPICLELGAMPDPPAPAPTLDVVATIPQSLSAQAPAWFPAPTKPLISTDGKTYMKSV